jgi:hypothetical protein
VSRAGADKGAEMVGIGLGDVSGHLRDRKRDRKKKKRVRNWKLEVMDQANFRSSRSNAEEGEHRGSGSTLGGKRKKAEGHLLQINREKET